MENASRALVIAGGILLAMLILSLLVFVFGSMNNWAETQDTRKLSQQIAQFNKGFEAYNKQRMYGADVITVVNKAIDNNKTVAPNVDDPWYVNIRMKVKQEFETTATRIDNSKSKGEDGYEVTLNSQKLNDLGLEGVISYSVEKLKEGKEYDLGKWYGEELQMNNGIMSFFTQPDANTVRNKDNCTYYIRSALTDFKSAIFKCVDTEIVYDTETGRIKEMTFEQIKTN